MAYRTKFPVFFILILTALLFQQCTTDSNQIFNKNVAPRPLPLSVTINTPSSPGVFNRDEAINFTGTAVLGTTDQLTGEQLVWTSNRDGIIGVGNGFTRSGLSSGEHLITLTATASTGEQNSDSVRIMIQPTSEALTVLIHTPAGQRLKTYDLLSLSGSAFTPDGQPVTSTLAFEWRSSIENRPGPVLGNGAQIEPGGLSPGLHTIILNVATRDNRGNPLTGTASIEVFVEFENTNISLEILAPQNGFQLSRGEDLTCVGSAAISGDSSFDNFTWTSSMDGIIGYSETCIVPSLSVGVHRITMTATTTEGKKASASIIVEVLP